MITFASLGEVGRLGNQLFQYAALRSLGLKNGYQVKIFPFENKFWHGQECLLGNFNISVDTMDDSDLDSLMYKYEEPDHMVVDKNFFDIHDYTNIEGFFQSTFYFREFEDEIKKELTPRNLDVQKSAMDALRRQCGCPLVSLHLRRGDNTNQTNPSDELDGMYGTSTTPFEESFYGKYLIKALNQFEGEKVKFLVFTGGKRWMEDNSEDIEWCKKNLLGDKFIFSEGNSPMEDFGSIMMCDHSIMSHVSSFGWWASFLSKTDSKRVVAPLHYHPDLPDFTHREGFFPEDFTLV
jgi:hypothetical protein